MTISLKLEVEKKEIPCGTKGFLKCKNGSSCKIIDSGTNSTTSRSKESINNPIHDHLGLLTHIEFSDKDNTDIYHCQCPAGYIGHDCSVQVSPCEARRSDLVHSCYYGSTCIEASNNFGLLDKYCDCSTASVDEGMFLAGLMCQHKSTSICLFEDNETENEQINSGKVKPSKNAKDQYCVNGGKCKSLVSPGEPHPGCICRDEKWEGKHCEFASGTLIDDALDLFQQRMAEIDRNGGSTIGLDLSWMDPQGEDDDSDTLVSLSHTFLLYGMFFMMTGIIIVFIVMLKLLPSKRRHQTQLRTSKEFEGDSSAGSTKTNSTDATHHTNPPTYRVPPPPPSNVFLASRKKEAESQTGENSTIFHVDFESQCFEKEGMADFCISQRRESLEIVEILDTETSQILEAQFEHSSLLHSSTSTALCLPTDSLCHGDDNERLSYDKYKKLGDPYYEEDLNEQTRGEYKSEENWESPPSDSIPTSSGTGRITVNCGHYPLSQLVNKNSNTPPPQIVPENTEDIIRNENDREDDAENNVSDVVSCGSDTDRGQDQNTTITILDSLQSEPHPWPLQSCNGEDEDDDDAIFFGDNVI